MQTKDFLRQSALFGQLSDRELDDVMATGRERSFANGTAMVSEGDPGARAFYLILEGTAQARKGSVVLAEFGPGDYFGEMALLLDDTPRTADVVATGDTRCLVMTQWDFRALLRGHPEFGAKMMTELAQRLRDTDRALSE
ncbi:MAG: Crp/Fnr family transcriptional regulator [Acidimicrobiia bacterium]